MIKVSNRKVISSLARKTLKANRSRNMIAIVAIVLTTVMFTALFTIALSVSHAFQQANFRQVGGYAHGGFKYLTEQQYEELRKDPLIKQYGLRRIVGMPSEPPFNKDHVEVGYSDALNMKWMFIDPVKGTAPAEGTRQAATDTRVLKLLGVEPKLGTPFTMTFMVDGKETTESFLLSGWWEYDEAIVASHVLIPESRAEEIFQKLGTKGEDGLTGTYNMDVMFSNSSNIEKNMKKVLANHGYQTAEGRSEDKFIAIGVNWGYTASQLAKSYDLPTLLSIAALLIVIIVTGYLIIYNVFQISVTNDIRFYGLLKTIGASGRQIRRMLRRQALLLSAVGLPLGLLLGYGIGVMLVPVVLSQLNGVDQSSYSASPLIFAFAGLFSLITVLLSCAKPGRMAGKVSPVEAVHYTDNHKGKSRAAFGKRKPRVALWQMARSNLGRSRGKTAVTILSLSLAVVLLNLTVTFTNGFDMDKYVSKMMAADFVIAADDYFQVGGELWNEDMALPEQVIEQIEAQDGLQAAGRIYGKTTPIEEYVTEEYYRSQREQWYTPEGLNQVIEQMEHTADGKLVEGVQLYGMDSGPLERLTVLEGDLSKLQKAKGRYVAAVYSEDDYGKPEMTSNWAKLGDIITLRYVEEYEYIDPESGEVLDSAHISEGQSFSMRAAKYREEQYEVAALVTVPHALSYRYYSADEFVMNSETFIQDTGTKAVMQYSFDTTDHDSNQRMESFLSSLTSTQQSRLDYESKKSYMQEFAGFRSMFLLLGGVLCTVIGLVGILNFLNAILTGIITRRREFAVLQSIGMTGRQLKTMLVWEGLYYTLGSLLLSLAISVISGLLLKSALAGMFWFFTYRFTLLPVLGTAPVFAGLGVCLPLLIYRISSRQTVVERLREIEG